MKSFHFHTTCVSSTAEAINDMCGSARQVSVATFRKYCEWRGVAKSLGYGRAFPMSKDWHVSYWKSQYKGRPCYYFEHSRIEYVFLMRPNEIHGTPFMGDILE